MIKVLFILRTSKIKANGESPIYAKVILDNQSTLITTGKNISAERWKSTNKLQGTLKIEKEKVLKQSLELLRLKLERSYNELSKDNTNITVDTFKGVIFATKKSSITYLLPVFDKHNADFKLKVTGGERSAASLQKYMRSKDLIKTFLKKKHNLHDIDINKVNSEFIYNLESFLKYESEFKGTIGIKNNSVVKYFKNFKTVCNFGVKIGALDKNPFNNYAGKLKVTEAVFLTQDELNRIENVEFEFGRLEKVRDIFLFSCYTGYAPIDACKLTSENLIKDSNGNVWIKAFRTKTDIKANVPVLPTVEALIEKYKDRQNTLLPKLSNQKMNAYLKEIADICRINKHLTWYVSRHTFATTVTLGNGIRIENVSAMMGHSNIKQTQHYAKVLDSSVMEDMLKLRDKLK